MSIHLHFRAVVESEIEDDHTWLAAYMSEAWDRHAEEYAAGVTDSIAKSWSFVNDLYAAADVAGTGGEGPWTLPIYGGRPVAHTPGADLTDPPMMYMDPPEVSQAAEFLAGVSFDELWNAVGKRLGGGGPDDALLRQEHLEHHESLRGFYGRAALSGHAVIKAVWA
ncbi:hypothetical protein SVTN_32900 [Streptomyces vietnamensis]|uniref:DUF1877 domain-containing protein n=1 Tax=Streptomyces vietnamensis TaxID=362257 RepID=A0A0B5I2R7_9ACTN|nr:hypothetical protein SVTN_32900 [Streptomyces vietnamensis]